MFFSLHVGLKPENNRKIGSKEIVLGRNNQQFCYEYDANSTCHKLQLTILSFHNK